MEKWKGKTAVVTGANGGIGFAVAQSLCKEGVNVVALDINDFFNDKKTESVLQATYRKCDVSQPEQVEDIFKWIEQTKGGVDILINCAGVIYHGTITDSGPHQCSIEELMQQIDVNVKSVVLCSRYAASSMNQRKVQGHIININSIIGHSISNQPIFNTYCASKHAVNAITQTLRVEFSTYKAGIKTTSVSPSLVRTRMADMEKLPELRAEVSRAPALQPEDIADAILYLLSTPPHVNVEELTISHVFDKRL